MITHIDTLNKKWNKYLTLVSTDKNKELWIKYTELWNKTKNLLKWNSIKTGEYEKDFMKVKFNSDGNLSLNKTLKLHHMTIVIRSIFEENGKYYLQAFLDECLYVWMFSCNRIDFSEEIYIN